MTDDDFTRLLAGADRPRRPRPEFAAALRAELLGEARRGPAPVAYDPGAHGPGGHDPNGTGLGSLDLGSLDLENVAVLEPAGRRRERTPGWVAAAVAAAVVLVVLTLAVGVFRPSGDPPPVAAPGPSRALDVTAAERACAVFDADAFGPSGRAGVLGKGNQAAFRDRAAAVATTGRLLQSLEYLRNALHEAGVGSALTPIDVATGRAEQAAAWSDQGNLEQARGSVQKIEELLVDAAARLTRQGVAACLG